MKAYKEKEKEAKGRTPERLMLDEAVSIILALLETNPATIVIDALDECDPARRQGLFVALRKLIQESASLVKVFVSNRDDHDIAHRLENSPNLYIHSEENGEDIDRFVNSQVTQAIRDEKLICGKVTAALKDHIIKTLTSKAEGMLVYSECCLQPYFANICRFRLVSLHIQSLCDPRQIKKDRGKRPHRLETAA